MENHILYHWSPIISHLVVIEKNFKIIKFCNFMRECLGSIRKKCSRILKMCFFPVPGINKSLRNSWKSWWRVLRLLFRKWEIYNHELQFRKLKWNFFGHHASFAASRMLVRGLNVQVASMTNSNADLVLLRVSAHTILEFKLYSMISFI